MINFKTSGPISLSGNGNTGDSPAYFIEHACNTGIDRSLTISGVFQAASGCGVQLSGSANYRLVCYERFYGMSFTSTTLCH